jgi:ribosomal protein L37AE/L43A
MKQQQAATDELDAMLERQLCQNNRVPREGDSKCPLCGQNTLHREPISGEIMCCNARCRYESDGGGIEDLEFADMTGRRIEE